MSAGKNNGESQPDECTSKSDFSMTPMMVPKTMQKKTIRFENDEVELSNYISKKNDMINDSFNPNQTYQQSEFDSPPEDEFDHNVETESVGDPAIPNEFTKKTVTLIKLALNSWAYTIFINTVTVYVLAADYFRIMIFRKNADLIFDIFTIFGFFGLLADFLMMLASQKKYFGSFYFFLDIIMTITIIFDVTFVSNAIFYGNQDKVLSIAASILNIIRIIRLIRIMKFLRIKGKIEPENPENKNEMHMIRKYSVNQNKKKPSLIKNIFAPKESKVTSELKNLNTRRIIIIVLLILILVPLFDNSLYYQDRSVSTFDKAVFSTFSFITNNQTLMNETSVMEQVSLDDSNQVLVQYVVYGIYNFTNPDLINLRKDEIVVFRGTIFVNQVAFGILMVVSQRYENVLQAMLGLFNTLFVGMIMIVSIWSLNNDMSTLVLNPLERMINKIKLIGINPLLAIRATKNKNSEENETNETFVIEAAINKITGLLMLGFGQAGCRIVSGFVLDPDRDIDQLIPGEKTFAIFGFCDIKGFSDVTEILVEDIMLFVNTIAEIVHQAVDEFAGATNKNIGEAFLMVWKLMDDGYKYSIDQEFQNDIDSLPETEMHRRLEKIVIEDRYNRQLAEFALLGFVKVLMEVNTNPAILKFAEHPLIKASLPGYQVKMSFGLHIGWAIEGAIGSSYKIDASYLSPNVNLASRIQYACKQFSLSILFSGNLYSLFSNDQLVRNSRHIDTVQLKGSKQPIKLYTLDVNYERLKKFKEETKNSVRVKNIRVDIKEDLQNQFLEILKHNNTYTNLENTVNKKSGLVKFSSMVQESSVEKKINEPEFYNFLDFDNIEKAEFRNMARFAVDSYLAGDWKTARILFERCSKMKPEDGPTSTILNYMRKANFELPEFWNNCREMTEK